jgi:hypothetical protein
VADPKLAYCTPLNLQIRYPQKLVLRCIQWLETRSVAAIKFSTRPGVSQQLSFQRMVGLVQTKGVGRDLATLRWRGAEGRRRAHAQGNASC